MGGWLASSPMPNSQAKPRPSCWPRGWHYVTVSRAIARRAAIGLLNTGKISPFRAFIVQGENGGSHSHS